MILGIKNPCQVSWKRESWPGYFG